MLNNVFVTTVYAKDFILQNFFANYVDVFANFCQDHVVVKLYYMSLRQLSYFLFEKTLLISTSNQIRIGREISKWQVH
jgi:hypothetical protein